MKKFCPWAFVSCLAISFVFFHGLTTLFFATGIGMGN